MKTPWNTGGSLPKGNIVAPRIRNNRIEVSCTEAARPALFLDKFSFGNCPDGTFYDKENGGECWSCPPGYIRNVTPIGSGDACWKSANPGDIIPSRVLHSPATLVKGCAKSIRSVPGFGTPFYDSRNGGECWACPIYYPRWHGIALTNPVDSDRACTAGGEWTKCFVWQSPQYPDPGVFAFSALVEAAFKDAKKVDAFITKRAKGNAQARRDLWKKMQENPGESAEYKALLFAALLADAKHNDIVPYPRTVAGYAVEDFQKYIVSRRTFVAQDAVNAYTEWTYVNSYNVMKGVRNSGGYPGAQIMDTLGGSPPDHEAYAQAAMAVPNMGGAEFLEALVDLGQTPVGVTTVNENNPGFDPVIVQAVLFGLDKVLDQYMNVATRFPQFPDVSIVNSAGRTMANIGAGISIGLTLVQATMDLTQGIMILNSQLEAQQKYSTLVNEMSKPVSVKALLNSQNAAERQSLLLYWALATSAYQGGPKAGDGYLNTSQLCSKTPERCKYSAALVARAGQSVGAIGIPPPPPAPPIPRVVSGAIYRHGSQDGRWANLGGGAMRIASGTGKEVWAVNEGGELWVWSNGSWAKICGAFQAPLRQQQPPIPTAWVGEEKAPRVTQAPPVTCDEVNAHGDKIVDVAAAPDGKIWIVTGRGRLFGGTARPGALPQFTQVMQTQTDAAYVGVSAVTAGKDGSLWAIQQFRPISGTAQAGPIVYLAPRATNWKVMGPQSRGTRIATASGADAWVVNSGGELWLNRGGGWAYICPAAAGQTERTGCRGVGNITDVAAMPNGEIRLVNDQGKIFAGRPQPGVPATFVETF